MKQVNKRMFYITDMKTNRYQIISKKEIDTEAVIF